MINKNKNQYIILSQIIESKYQNIIKFNPLIFNTINHQLRLDEVGEGRLVDKNLKKVYKRYLVFSFITKLLFQIYLRLRFSNNKKKVFFIRTNTFSDYSYKRILKELEKNYLVIGSGTKILSTINHIKYIISEAFIFDILERTSNIYRIFHLYNCKSSVQLKKLLKNKLFLDELNLAINKDIIFIGRVLNFAKIKSILINTDQTVFANIFIHTAKINNIKTAVLAHGNFSSPFAVGVLPLFADRLFVWSKKVKNDLNKLSNKKNIEYIEGINKYIILPKELNNSSLILFVASPTQMYRANNYVREYLTILKIIRNISPKLSYVFVPHPQDDLSLKKEIINLGFKWKRNNLYNLASKSKLVIGAHTSFLHECYQSRIPSFQLKEICFNNNDQTTEGIPYLSINDICNLNKLNEVINNLRIHKKEINFEKLLRYFCKI